MNSERKVVSISHHYVSLEDEVDDPLSAEPPSLSAQMDLSELNTDNGILPGATPSSTTPHLPKRVRLRAVESERDYFLNLINVSLFRKLVIVQAVATALIMICQVILYATVSRGSFKMIDRLGIGLWAPILFFSVACLLTWISTRSPSGCVVGTAMGFQITTIVTGLLLIFFASISLMQHGQYNYWRSRLGRDDDEVEYDEEIPGRILCSTIILAGVGVSLFAFVISIMFCRITCCSKSRAHETIMFDVEAVK